MNDDFRIIDDILTGRKSEFARLVDRYQTRLCNSLTSAMGNRADAEDITQDAFLQAYLQLHRFKRTSAFYTWLYRIALNLAGTHGRRNRPAVSLDRCADLGHETPDHEDSPARHCERLETQSLVRAALNRLSGEHRAILELRDLRGFEYDNVAQRLDIPLGTVRSRLFRARAKMREQVGKMLDSTERQKP